MNFTWKTSGADRWIDIDKKAFIEWLSQFDDTDSVGQARSNKSCPLYNFLNKDAQDHPPVLSVAETYARNYYDSETYRLPFWAEEFVAAVDGQGEDEYLRIKAGSIITKRRAMAILANKQEKYYDTCS